MNTERLLAIASFSPQILNFPNPWVGHLPFAAWIIRELSPQIFVELGTHTGNSYFAFCQSVAEAGLATKCYAVDTWQGDVHAGEYDDEVYSRVNAHNNAHFSNFSQLLRMTFDQALDSFADGTINLLHIDGLHTYEAVRHDFETWRPKLAPGAVILFHDTNIYEPGFGVWRFWQELRAQYHQTFTFPHSCGLGIVRVDTDDAEDMEWLQPDFPLRANLEAYFLALGFHQLDRYELTQTNTRLSQLVAEQERRLASLSNDLAEQNEQLAVLRNTLDQRDAQITCQWDDIAGRDRQIADMLASSSWRLTRPLRGARRFLGDFSATPGIALTLCRMIWHQLRLHGPLGFVRRLPHYFRHPCKALSLIAGGSLAVDGGMCGVLSPALRDFRLHPDLVSGKQEINESLSIVIPTLNAGGEFPLLLRKLMAQRGLGSIEIVVVDSGSRDQTVRIARAAGCTVVEIPSTDFSHSHARNVGADAASGRYLLFMVQDAYPIGSYWAYGMLAYLLEHADHRLAAVSCAEYSRSDSDLMYDSLINTHYRFLGCLDANRQGEFQGDDHLSLRANGQLSDVACLISRELFNTYRYRGAYAEDLDLGIRLIKDGYRVGMMSSVKVVHSHNRSVHYYLKRSFVDTVFLTGLFTDFPCPRILSPQGIIAGIVSVAAHLSQWRLAFEASDSTEILHRELAHYITRWGKEFRKPRLHREPCLLGAPLLDAYIDSLAERYLPSSITVPRGAFRSEMYDFLETFISQLERFNAFAQDIHGHQDGVLRQQLRDVVLKTFAAAAGSLLAFMYIRSADFEPQDRRMAETLYNELKAGI